jgi:hypothetical protein
VAPVLSNLALSNSIWREGHKPATLARARHPLGTIISFTLNEPASVSFAFTKSTIGRAVGHRCVALTRSNTRHRRCARKLAEGTLTLAAHAGVNKLAFDGVVSTSKRLSLGKHNVVILARNSSGQRSAPHSLAFTIEP